MLFLRRSKWIGPRLNNSKRHATRAKLNSLPNTECAFLRWEDLILSTLTSQQGAICMQYSLHAHWQCIVLRWPFSISLISGLFPAHTAVRGSASDGRNTTSPARPIHSLFLQDSLQTDLLLVPCVAVCGGDKFRIRVVLGNEASVMIETKTPQPGPGLGRDIQLKTAPTWFKKIVQSTKTQGWLVSYGPPHETKNASLPMRLRHLWDKGCRHISLTDFRVTSIWNSLCSNRPQAQFLFHQLAVSQKDRFFSY